jgi:hypothetical protein
MFKHRVIPWIAVQSSLPKAVSQQIGEASETTTRALLAKQCTGPLRFANGFFSAARHSDRIEQIFRIPCAA